MRDPQELLKNHLTLSARLKASVEEGTKLSAAGNIKAAAKKLAEAEKLQVQLTELENSVKRKSPHEK